MSSHKDHQEQRNATHFPARTNTLASASDPTMLSDVASDGRVRRKIMVELLEDMHPGSGAGGGGIDALVTRDRHGRPVIWASHLEGVLRDAALRIHGPETANNFFGLAGGQQQHAVFTSLYTDSSPVSRLWRSTARVAFDNRAPKDDSLRVVEYVPKGTRFNGQVELPASNLPLLRRLLQEVDALGHGRATGFGRAKLSLVETQMPTQTVGHATGHLVLLLRNLDPVCMTATATPDNLIPSLGFMPGRALLGALARWLLNGGHQDTAALLINGRLSVSDAMPVPRVPQRLSVAEVLPAPLSLQSEKPVGVADPVPWWAQSPVRVRRVESYDSGLSGTKLKRPEDNLFVFRTDASAAWETLRTQLRVRLRNGRPDPKKNDPSLFAIEQIAEDSLFLCDIRGAMEDMRELANDLDPILQGNRWLRLGRAGAPVEVVQIEWVEGSSSSSSRSQAILALTSDLLMRDEYLRWCTNLDEARFRTIPGWPEDVCVTPLVQEAVAVHGFNGTSRLWRMPAWGIRRGSVFKVDGEGVARLARRVAEGHWLGERTHEGFGRFRLDDSLPGVTSDMPSQVDTRAVEPDDVEDMVAATTCQWFEDHRALTKPGNSSDRRPSLSQWLDLVSGLETKDCDALTSRLNPTTAGKRSWNHPDAKKILNKLAAISDDSERISHASLFVHWLRAGMRGRNA